MERMPKAVPKILPTKKRNLWNPARAQWPPGK